MYRLEDPKNEISSYEWENDLGRLICGNLVYLNEIIENISENDLELRLSLMKENENVFKLFESFYEPLIYYMYKNKISPRIEKCKKDGKSDFFGRNSGGVAGDAKENKYSTVVASNNNARHGESKHGDGLECDSTVLEAFSEEDVERDDDDEDEEKYIFSYKLSLKSGNKTLSDLFRFGKTYEVNIDEIFDFVLSLLYVGRFNISSFIMAIINMSNLIKKSNILVCQHNWRPIFVTSLLISDKLWDDNCVKSGDLSEVVGFVSPRMIKYLEFVFLENSEWSFEFDLNNIKTHISKVLKKELNKKLIDKVINSGFYQSYCHEDLYESNSKQDTNGCKKKSENKELGMNTSLTGGSVMNCFKKDLTTNAGFVGHGLSQRFSLNSTSTDQKIGFISNKCNSMNISLMGGIENKKLVQPQLPPRSLSFYRSNICTKMGDQISSGRNSHNQNSMMYLSSNTQFQRKQFFSPLGKSNSVFSSKNFNIPPYSSLRNPSLNPQLRGEVSKSNLNQNVFGGNSNRLLVENSTNLTPKHMLFNKNVNNGVYPRSMTPDNHIMRSEYKQNAENPAFRSLVGLERGVANKDSIRMSSNPHSLLEKKVSSGSVMSPEILKGGHENGGVVLGGGFLSSGNLNTIKRSSSENRKFNFGRNGVSTSQQPLKRDGLFSYARNTVSSAITSITRTLGFSSDTNVGNNSMSGVVNNENKDRENHTKLLQQNNCHMRNLSLPTKARMNNTNNSIMNSFHEIWNRNAVESENAPFSGRNIVNRVNNNELSKNTVSTERSSYCMNQANKSPNSHGMSSSNNLVPNQDATKASSNLEKPVLSNMCNSVMGGEHRRSFSVHRPQQQYGLSVSNISSSIHNQAAILSSRLARPPTNYGSNVSKSTIMGMSNNKYGHNNIVRSNVIEANNLINNKYNTGVTYIRNNAKGRSSSRSMENCPSSLTLNNRKEESTSIFSMNRIINPISNLLRSRDPSLTISSKGNTIGENKNSFGINFLMRSKLTT